MIKKGCIKSKCDKIFRLNNQKPSFFLIIIVGKGKILENFAVKNLSSSIRLDIFLTKTLKISRNKILNLIKENHIFVNNSVQNKASFKLKNDDIVGVNFPLKKENENLKQNANFDIEILYEDDDLLVLNKPSGVVVHPAKSVKEPTLAEWLKQKKYMLSSINGDERAGIVHRLDKQTSGAILVAKTDFAHVKLAAQLKDKSMGRIYLAFLDLALKENVCVDRFIARNPSNRLKKAVVLSNENGARSAKSAFLNIANDTILQNFKPLNFSRNQTNFNLIAAKLFTGRTHQIRVHLSSINRHIIGDFLYGFKSDFDKIKRIFLHAYLLYFTHPRTNMQILISAKIPSEIKNLIEKSDFKDEIYEKILPSNLISAFDDCDQWMCLK